MVKGLLAAVAAVFLTLSALADEALVRAEISGPRAVWLITDAENRPLDKSSVTLETASGTAIEVADLVASTATRTLVVPADSLDITRVHYLTLNGQRTRVRFDGWFRSLYSAKPLGAEVSDDKAYTDVRLFAPRATGVTLHLYDAAVGGKSEDHALTRDMDGVWETRLPKDLAGRWYDFSVRGHSDPGNRFYDTHPVRISDPYARVSDDSFGRSRIAYRTAPARPLADGRPAMEDVVAYEVHVQDFTDRLPIEAALKGRMAAMTRPGIKNARGEAVGFDYLKSLGVNVVHLMPMQEYLHYPDVEWQAAFKDDPEMQRLGIAEENYQWGYRTTHAFAVETRFRTPGTEAGQERNQFRDLVEAFHAEGMAVIIDIVPNHTGENMDGRDFAFNFNVADKYYYYRVGDNGEHIGPYGNEVKTEDRPMVQRWIVDQMVHWVEEFGIDGFRIDLAGQIDEQTLLAAKAALPADIILYGEPWIDVTDPYVRANPDWDWYKADSPITFFQDDARNAMKGSPFVLEDQRRDNGFAGGNGTLRADVMRALENRYAEEKESPNQGLNYLDIHDNWALSDRFAVKGFDARRGVDAARLQVAATLLMTSQGPVVIHGGTEMIRSKGLAGLEEFVRETSTGELHFKGRDDTYNQRAPNQFLWETVGATLNGGPLPVQEMTDWWKGLIALRMSDAGRVFRSASPVEEGHYQWVLPESDTALGYIVGDRVAVVINSGSDRVEFDMPLSEGVWINVAETGHFDMTGLEGGSSIRLESGDGPVPLSLSGAGVKIFVKK